jgi:outer membrane protein assembly factor BamB
LTTRCSSAFALIASCWVVVCAQTQPPAPFPRPPKPAAKPKRVDRTPPALFPVASLWTLALNNMLTVPAAYDATHVFFAIEGDQLVAYDILSGDQQWLVAARPQFQPTTGDNLLFVVESESLVARNADDGEVAWEMPLGGKPPVRPAWDNGWLVVSTDQGVVLGLRAADGHVVWQRDLKSAAHGLPGFAGDRVYVSTRDRRIVALRVESGEPIWERRFIGVPADILALPDRVYAGSSDDYLYCLMADAGAIDWRWRTGGDIVGAPVTDGNRVYFVALDNVLRALDHKSGVQQWMRPLPIRPAWSPVLIGSTVAVAGVATSVKGFAIKDGAPAGDFVATSEVTTAPYVLDDPVLHRPMLLVTTRDIAKGATATLNARSFEPPLAPVSPLPNLIRIAPTPSTTATPRPQ